MRKVFLSALAALVLLAANSQTAQSAEEIDRVIAHVESDVILKSELDRKVATITARLQASGTRMPPQDVLRKQVLERMITDRVQLEMGKRAGVRISDAEVNRAVASVAERNNLTLPQFKAQLASDGVDFDLFREDLREEIMISQVRSAQVNRRVRLSDREIESFVENMDKNSGEDIQYHLGHILIPVPENASNERIGAAREKSAELVQALRDGADFAETAIAESAGQEALQGGDFGWRSEQQLPTLFTGTVTGMKTGEVSEPLRSGSGFHILKLFEKKGEQQVIVEETNVRHILIAPDAITTSKDARTQLALIRDRIARGDSTFEEEARKHSDDRGNANLGGELGWKTPANFVPEFAAAMTETGINEISPPFETQFGWHILEVLGRRAADQTEEAKKQQAARILHNRKYDEEVEAWVREVRDQAYIKYVEVE